MNICIVSTDYPAPSHRKYVFVEQLVNEMVNQGVDISVIAPQSITRHLLKGDPLLAVDSEKKIGIGISKINEYKLDPNIQYNYKNNESGASGGLMLSLALYNALTEEDITKGKNISGTGTISEDGTVGEISGVKYKLSGAVKNKCDIFIAPRANYEEALKEKNKNKFGNDFVLSINKLG